MSVVELYLVTDDADAVEAAGSAHPVLGRLIDTGTYTRIVGLDTDQPLAAVAELCAREPAGMVSVDFASWPAVGQADQSAAVFVAVCGSAHQAPLVVACGPGLPSMGRMPPSHLDTLLASVRFAAGAGELDGSVFAELPVDVDAEQMRLRERLRQLYGE
jgi:hypothetical protein